MISKASIEDATKIAAIVNSAYRGDTSRLGWTMEADLLDGVRISETGILDMLNTPDAHLLKYETSQGNLLGCVYLEKQDSVLYLGMLTVSPFAQNKGTGKELVQAAEEFARMQQCTIIRMTVISVRHELIKWYERFGYKQTGEIKPFPDDPRFGIPKTSLEFIVLEKQL